MFTLVKRTRLCLQTNHGKHKCFFIFSTHRFTVSTHDLSLTIQQIYFDVKKLAHSPSDGKLARKLRHSLKFIYT